MYIFLLIDFKMDLRAQFKIQTHIYDIHKIVQIKKEKKKYGFHPTLIVILVSRSFKR